MVWDSMAAGRQYGWRYVKLVPRASLLAALRDPGDCFVGFKFIIRKDGSHLTCMLLALVQ